MPPTPDDAVRNVLTVSVDHEEWHQVSALAESGPDDKVFAVNSAGYVVFGDGTHGRRPATESAVTVSFANGGGEAGNVGISMTTRWPPRDARYLIALVSGRIGIGVSDATAAVERFGGDRRPSFFAGQLLIATDLEDQQQYLIGKRHLHNRALHGSGVVAGLAITVEADTSASTVVVEPGLALDLHGRELELRVAARVELGNAAGAQYIVIDYTERGTDQVPLPGDSTQMVPTRFQEGVSIRLSDQQAGGDGVTLARLVPETTGWVVDGSFEPSRCR